MPEQKVWACPNCQWVERAHPTYGWSKHNDRAVEVHEIMLCPALKENDNA